MLTSAGAGRGVGGIAPATSSSGACMCSTPLGDEVLLDLGSRRTLLKSLQAQDQEIELNLLGYLVRSATGGW